MGDTPRETWNVKGGIVVAGMGFLMGYVAAKEYDFVEPLAVGLVGAVAGFAVIAPPFKVGGRESEPNAAFARKNGWVRVRTTALGAAPPSVIEGRECFPFTEGKTAGVIDHHFGGEWKGHRAETAWLVPGYTTVENILEFRVDVMTLPRAIPRLDLFPSFSQYAIEHAPRAIEFESGEFNARWSAVADDPRYAHAFLHPGMLALLLRLDGIRRLETLDIGFSVGGNLAVLWRPNDTVDATRVEARLDLLAEFVETIADFVFDEYGSGRGPGRGRSRR